MKVDSTVEPNFKATVYTQMLIDRGHAPRLALMDAPVPGGRLALANAFNNSDSDEEAGAEGAAIHVMTSLLPTPVEPPPPAFVPIAASASSGSASSRDPMPPVAGIVGGGDHEDDIPVILAPAVGAVSGFHLKYGSTVEGVRITESSYTDDTHDYVRLYAKCPLWKCKHVRMDKKKECGRYRNVHEAQMRNFGIAEVYSYLGCWTRAAGSKHDRDEHMKYKPSLVDQRAYAHTMGWL